MTAAVSRLRSSDSPVGLLISAVFDGVDEGSLRMRAPDWALRTGGRLWRRHPAIRTGDQLSRGERAADRLRNGMGSWAFVFISLVFLAGWMLGNRNVGFDPYPFIPLNLVLSCVAALQGAILLIAAKRVDQISAELALHDYQINTEALALIRGLHDVAVGPTLGADPTDNGETGTAGGPIEPKE